MRAGVALLASVVAAAFAASAPAANVKPGPAGTFLKDDAKIFPIVISKGPPRTGTTPTGANALDELVAAGVNFFKVGPATTVWNDADIEDARLWDQAAAARGVYTWVNFSTLSTAPAGSPRHAILKKAIETLEGDPGSAGLGMYKGMDEPWWNSVPVSSLRFTYCLATSRGDPAYCSGNPPLDSDHAWVTIQAPRGTAADLAPYSEVTDTHGVDEYPVTYAAADPDLHSVGRWTATLVSVTPNRSVWTTLQVCASGSSGLNGAFVLPTREQERYMIYDSIINGARSVGFYGANLSRCWNASDTTYEWNWTFWNGVLKSLVQEISAISPLAPALVNTQTNQVLTTSDPSTQAISRQGAAPDELWVIAARSGTGTADVTISGIPTSLGTGSVYTEGRSISAASGSFTDAFARWAVHVYHFAPPVPTAATVLGFTARRSGKAVVLRWRIARGARLLGFHLYRGPTRMNRHLIPLRGASYVWRDPRGAPSYRLEAITLDGKRSSVRTTSRRSGTR